MRVTVIGAGVAGLACAVELAEQGATVDVLDRGNSLGASSCSWYAGGMLAPWCELANGEPLIAQLGSESMAWWRRRCSSTVSNGSLVVAHARDSAELSQFSRRSERFEWLDADRLATAEPDLAGRFDKALFFREEAHLDPRAALQSLATRLEELGVQLRFGVTASVNDLRQRCVVNCTGLAARETLRDLRGVRGEMLLLRSNELALSRPVRVLHPRIPMYIVPRAAGLFMVGATMIESDHAGPATARSVMELLNAAYALHPAFGEAEIVEIGVGVRPAFPDHLPRMEWQGEVLHVNGLFRHGFLLAPALARKVAHCVLEERRSLSNAV
jgi:glycine oxidase